MGFAEARIDVRAFRVVMIPALAIETVCCSYKMSVHWKDTTLEPSRTMTS